jgi:putative DNA primase/helicase
MKARNAALELSGGGQEPVSLPVELLADIRDIFDQKTIYRISTADLIVALVADDQKPWLA